MDPHLVRRSKAPWILGILFGLVLMMTLGLVPVFDCPMCGNPPTTAYRLCYCGSKGRVGLLLRLQWPSRRAAILDAMGFCGDCEKRRAIVQVSGVKNKATGNNLILCGECVEERKRRIEKSDGEN